MAFLDDSGIQSQTQTQGAGGQVASTGTPSAPNVSGVGSSDVHGVSTAGIGQGGTGGWTNIQAYLNANQGDQGSANNLRDAVGGQFSKEQGQLQNSADKTINDANSYVKNSNISQDQANSLIGQAANAYTYADPNGSSKGGAVNAPNSGGAGDFSGMPYQKATRAPQAPAADQQTGLSNNPAYGDIVNTFKTALTGQWGMPTSFAPGLSGQAQAYGDQVNNDQGFQNLMNQLYSDKSGTPLTSGQSALQNQFDSGNQSLTKARQDLQGQYQGLQNTASDLGQNVSNQLGTDQNQFLSNQNTLKDYLNQQSGNYDKNIGKEQQDAHNAYQGEYNAGSNRADALTQGHSIFGHDLANPDYFQSLGISSPNMTWAQLQKEGDVEKGNPLIQQIYGGNPSSTSSWDYGQTPSVYQALHNDFEGNQNALSNFYNTEDQKYANTADPDKRAFNSIQDFLGNTGNQKQQGFNVRG